jgi:protoheme IX farnesyltransferase
MSSMPGTVSIAEEASLARRVTGRVAGFVALTKPRIIELLLVTTVPAMIVAARGWPRWTLILATLVGGTLAAGGANAINMFVDRDIDAVMHRTRGRPLVTGAVSPLAAIVFALCLEVAAFVELWVTVNPLSAVLAIGAMLFYVFVYTLWLKRTSTQNVVIGGAAGAVPVLVGWAAVRDSVGWAPIVLFVLMFVWTPPHFWALAIKYRDDYRSVHVPMLPAVATLERTARRIFCYTLLVVAVSLVFAWTAGMGWLYWVSAALLGAVFAALALDLLRRPTEAAAMRLFQWSITYVTLLFAAMAVDQLLLH